MTIASPTDMDVTQAASAPARSRQQTRQRLVEAATRLFAARGLHGVTSHDIAREAGVASGTFYLHFRDKTDVYRHIVFDAVEQLGATVQQLMATAGSGAIGLRARAEAIVAFAESHRDVVRVVFSTDTEAADVESDALAHMAAGLETRLRLEKEQGLFPPDLDPAVCARAHVGMTAHLIDWWTEDPTRATREDIVETLTRLQFTPATVRPQE